MKNVFSLRAIGSFWIVALASTAPMTWADDGAAPRTVSIAPMAAPDPMLRYRFWPAAEHRQDRDPMPGVLRALILMHSAVANAADDEPNEYEQHFQWNELPLDQLPVDDVHRSLDRFNTSINELMRIENAMKIHYDLGVEALSVNETIGLLLPEFQDMRMLCRILELKARLAILEHRYDEAIETVRIGFRLSEVASQSTPFLVGRLIGIAIAERMLQVVEAAVVQPDFPNVYWALAALPSERLFEVRQAIEFESTLLTKMLPGAPDMSSPTIGQDAAASQLLDLADQAHGVLVGTTSSPDDDHRAAMLMMGMYVAMMAEPSRDGLQSTDVWKNRAGELSDCEAVLRWTSLRLRRFRDQWEAWQTLPPDVFAASQSQRWMLADDSESRDLAVRVARELTPSFQQYLYNLRAYQHRSWLMTIEAIRMHADQTGELPATLEKLSPVPAWDDPIASGPFVYQRTDAEHATLTRASTSGNDVDLTVQLVLKGKS
ncbi:hypothetical protein Poly51_56790 [Rubripirellula tenax]|uniref:Secreted protein n=1 Tax=Rubripirellula tenax TaxID=2528015 RepID=A0A5C6E9D8_9BACT|nr:hypothetical protein [Rubripirellula tenax]TWU46283.1 hypothetical protein Poly51_56790 [Rubripirellula tenax]